MFRVYEKEKSVHDFLLHHLMQGIKDDRCCATLPITLNVGCLMQLNTSMGKTGKSFFLTAPFNLYVQSPSSATSGRDLWISCFLSQPLVSKQEGKLLKNRASKLTRYRKFKFSLGFGREYLYEGNWRSDETGQNVPHFTGGNGIFSIKNK